MLRNQINQNEGQKNGFKNKSETENEEAKTTFI